MVCNTLPLNSIRVISISSMRDLNSVHEDEIIHQPTQTTSLEQVSTQPSWAPETSMLGGGVGGWEGDET